MQATIDIGYEQVFQLAWQLSPRDRERLAKEIVSAEPETVPADTEPRPDLIVLEQGDGYRILQVPYADTEEGRMRQKETEELQKQHREEHPELFVQPSKEEIEKRRQTLNKWMTECPSATPEEIQKLEKSIKNFRKEFNDAIESRRLGLIGSD